MLLQDILVAKGDAVHTIGPDSTLADVAEKLVEENCGSLVVVEEDQMIGIITERDILRTVHARQSLEDTQVQDRMTVDVVSGNPENTLAEAMGVMTDHRIRHLPVLNGEKRLVGMISIGDLVKAQHDHLTMENHYLKNYLRS